MDDWQIQQYVREIANGLWESVVFRDFGDFGGNDYRLRPSTGGQFDYLCVGIR